MRKYVPLFEDIKIPGDFTEGDLYSDGKEDAAFAENLATLEHVINTNDDYKRWLNMFYNLMIDSKAGEYIWVRYDDYFEENPKFASENISKEWLESRLGKGFLDILDQYGFSNTVENNNTFIGTELTKMIYDTLTKQMPP
jgi:hypothetical protein